MLKVIKGIYPLFITTALVYLLGNGFGSVPPLGKLLSPFEGFLQNSRTTSSDRINLEGLQAPVELYWDENHVPHLFAENEDDLYMAQGYVVASDRLWQMEFYTMVSAGRLTEIVGERALGFDQYNRRRGMAKAAAEIAENLKKDPVSSRILHAYASGVNAYITSLRYEDLPLEYKILNYKPELWSPYKTILMLMNMRNTLSGKGNDTRLTEVLKTHGMEVVDELFPMYPVTESPIIPSGTNWDFEPIPIPEVPSVTYALPESSDLGYFPEPNKGIGSNNWAVAGSKSSTGLPILANDPHLGLTLPSIWYQMQLHAPGMNVYGSTLPGTPGIIIGFNKEIAWGVTNVGSDVLDYYKITFKDQSKNQYRYEGNWREVSRRIEKYQLKSGKVVTDTLLYTHHGPIVYMEKPEGAFATGTPAGYAMRWAALETDKSDMLTFYYLNHAKNYEDYKKALAFYTSPAQNFIFASNQDEIAISPNGKFPLKWKGQGRFLLDGSRKDHEWQGWIPSNQNPIVKNPPRGYVSSANQFSTDSSYPYYLDWKFADYYRGTRINSKLEKMQNATADSLRMLQNDNYNLAGERFLRPFLLVLNEENKANPAFRYVENWDKYNHAESVGASIFEEWMDAFMKLTWEDQFSREKGLMYPTEDETYQVLLDNPNSKWWDDISTAEKIENAADIINLSFTAAVDSLTLRNGPINDKSWAWANVKATAIPHLVPAFSSFGRFNVPIGGGWRIVNAATSTTGPSWRMVVELDKDWPRAYGVYPGGQSGNPGSKFYDNMVDTWSKGELIPLLFMKDKNDSSSKIKKQITLSSK